MAVLGDRATGLLDFLSKIGGNNPPMAQEPTGPALISSNQQPPLFPQGQVFLGPTARAVEQAPVMPDMNQAGVRLTAEQLQGRMAPVAPAAPPAQERGFMDRASDMMGSTFGDESWRIRKALALNSMRLNPDTGLAAALTSRLKDIEQNKLLQSRGNATLEALRKAGVPEKDLQVLANDPELLREYAKKFFAKDLQALPADQQAFENLIAGMSEADQEKARRIKAGLDPRAGSQFALDLNEVFARAAAQAGGAQKGKSEEERKQVQVQNDKTWNIWETAISGLEESLGNTATGKIVGLLPAISSSQQIAEQAIAIMAPVLKNIFRESGEGVFTDKDQQILIDMIPDRTSNPETIAYAIKMINDIVAAKLNQDIKVEIVPNESAGSTVLRFDAQGNPIQ